MDDVPRYQYDWRVLVQDKDLQNAYTIQVKNRFAYLQEETASTNETDVYERFIQANKKARKQLIPKKKGKQHPIFADDDRIQKARMQLQTAHDCYVNSPTST